MPCEIAQLQRFYIFFSLAVVMALSLGLTAAPQRSNKIGTVDVKMVTMTTLTSLVRNDSFTCAISKETFFFIMAAPKDEGLSFGIVLSIVLTQLGRQQVSKANWS